jgi:hypothetical protein
MAFMKWVAGAAALGAAMLVSLFTPSAQAAYIVALTQQGSNVVATGSGTIDLAGLSSYAVGTDRANVAPFGGGIATGPATPVPMDLYTGVTGPTSFGSGGETLASSGSGDIVALYGLSQFLEVPAGYASGNPLSDTATYDNQTFASFDATPGTYVWTWGSGADADSFMLQIGGPASSVPEPATALLFGIPLAVLVLARRNLTPKFR